MINFSDKDIVRYYIDDFKHFKKLSKQFDKSYKCSTYLTYMTLDQVRLQYTRHSVSHIQKLWQKRIDKIFQHNDVRIGSQMPTEEFTYLNNIVSFNESFKQFGFKIVHPLHVIVMNHKSLVHPGNKRIEILYEHYLDPVPVVITDYTNTIKIPGKMQKYDFQDKRLYYEFRKHTWYDPFNSVPVYKEINSAQQGFFNDHSFSKMDHLNEERIFTYRYNTVLCNDQPILKKVKEKWQTIINTT
jgi:hypothetical protein